MFPTRNQRCISEHPVRTLWSRVQRIVLVAMLTLTTLAIAAAGSATPASAMGSFQNSAVADHAVTFNGQSQGECIAFVEKVLSDLSGGAINMGYASTLGYHGIYVHGGGQLVESGDVVNAQKGDIIQLSPFSNSWSGNGHQHTTIVLDPPSSGAGWRVIDSNWNFTTTVKIHSGNDVLNWAHKYSLMIEVWRFGQVAPPPPAPVTNRSLALRHTGPGGYELRSDGSIVAFGGAPTLTNSAQKWNWDIARSIVLLPNDIGGYVLDGWGGVQPFGNAPVLDTHGAYWSGWDIARSIVLTADGQGGYLLDGWGGVHALGNAPVMDTHGAFWSGWDIARSIVLTADGRGGYTLDGWGGVHQLGNAPSIDAAAHGAYWSGHDIARTIADTPSAGVWDVDATYGFRQLA